MMAECKDCIHFCVCSPYTAPNESYPEVDGCKCFRATADVVPKSEVERLEEKCAILNEKNAQLALALFRDFPTTKELEVWEACEAVKTKVARDIFEDIETCIMDTYWIGGVLSHELDANKLDELKKKYIGETE